MEWMESSYAKPAARLALWAIGLTGEDRQRQTPNREPRTANGEGRLIVKSGQYPIAFAWRAQR
jgi:hypothetical protein